MSRTFARGLFVTILGLAVYGGCFALLCRWDRRRVNAILETSSHLPPTSPIVRTRSSIIERNGQTYIKIETSPSP